MAEPEPGARVDWSGPLEQVADNREVLRDIVGAYVEEIRENLAVLPESLASQRWSDARRQAHTLKGAMRMFGVPDGIRLGQELEDAAAAGRDDCVGLLAPLRAVAEQVIPQLEHFARTGEAGPG